MLARKSSTLSSFSVLVVTFLKYSPAFLPDVAGGGPCAAAGSTNVKPLQRVANPAMTKVSFHQTFIYCSSIYTLGTTKTQRHKGRAARVQICRDGARGSAFVSLCLSGSV